MMAKRKTYSTLENCKSLSLRFNQREWDMLHEIIERRNAISEPHCRVTKTHLLKQLMLNWIIDNEDTSKPPYGEKPFP